MRRSRAMAYLAAACLTTLAAAFAALDPVYEVPSHTIDGGGGYSGGGIYTVSGTIGQPDTAVSSGGGYAVAGGFWPAPEPCLGDTDGNQAVDVDDLTAVILDWGNCCTFNGDVDGDGDVDVDDLTIVILAWGVCP